MRLFVAIATVVLASSANAQIYRCETGNGVVEYSNTPASGKDKACKAVDLPTVTTIPAPKTPAAKGRNEGRNEGRNDGRTGGGSADGASAKAPDGFPKVDPSTQRSRDADRKRIIAEELKKEELKMAEIKKEYNGGEPERQGDERNYQKYLDRVQRLKDDIARTEVNIDSLKKELGSVR